MSEKEEKAFYTYRKNDIGFTSSRATQLRTVYMPLCGPKGDSIKSSITPFLSGDIKIDKSRYLTKPTSRENLREAIRNFFIRIDDQGVFSLAEPLPNDESEVEIAPLWHKLTRNSEDFGLKVEALNFTPASGENVELMKIVIHNTTEDRKLIRPTAAIPVFARALENKHDHEHVTSLLNRIEQLPNGVCVTPTMLFNEEGHRETSNVYYVLGFTPDEDELRGTYPTIQSFCGEGGTLALPEAVLENYKPEKLKEEDLNGQEAMGALRFKKHTLFPGESIEYYIIMGIATSKNEMNETFEKFSTDRKFKKALQENKDYWNDLAERIDFQTADKHYNRWLHWVTLQPVFRRIFGCSFLPDHDYGKGGKGWRDIWQDLLSLILIEPETVRQTLIDNFAGVRIDGSNATIIGQKPGEFFADRNAISRVWMDHGAWPFLTLLLYIHQTGDFDILFEQKSYFRDAQLSRTLQHDYTWIPEYGNELKTTEREVYQGTLLEHVLVQQLVQFFNVGEHNNTRLEHADWNDGFDMAFDRGECPTFMGLYAGNLLELSDLLKRCSEVKGIKEIEIAEELKMLLDTLTDTPVAYQDAQRKREFLTKRYFPAVEPQLNGKKVKVLITDVIEDLKKKADWVFEHIRKQEVINVDGHKWFNGYYDNQGEQVDGKKENIVRMTLTSQVFPIMSGVAKDEDVEEVIKAVDRYLKDEKLGGYRLNTNFQKLHYLDMGRAFGFAFGTKENGSFFSHMIVMYAYALYKRGFAKKGHEVLQSIYSMCADSTKAQIYPGIPEYFDSKGRGMYHYLTGSASWLVLTQLTQAFGVRGYYGDLLLEPKLMGAEFNKVGVASVHCEFSGKRLGIEYVNEALLDHGEYQVKAIYLGDSEVEFEQLEPGMAIIKRDLIDQLNSESTLRIALTSK